MRDEPDCFQVSYHTSAALRWCPKWEPGEGAGGLSNCAQAEGPGGAVGAAGPCVLATVGATCGESGAAWEEAHWQRPHPLDHPGCLLSASPPQSRASRLGHASWFRRASTQQKQREQANGSLLGFSSLVGRLSSSGFSLVFCLFRATPAAYGSSQTRGRMRAAAAGLRHRHSHAGSLTH